MSVIALVPVKVTVVFLAQGIPETGQGLGLSVPGCIFIGFLPCLLTSPRLAGLSEVYGLVRHRLGQDRGPIICSGRTTRSKVSSSTKPSAMASSFNVVPFLWAVFATLVALS